MRGAGASPGFLGLPLLLSGGLLAGTILQFLIGTLAPGITRDLGLTENRFGLAVTLLFAVGGGAAASSGRVIAIVGLRRAFVGVQVLVLVALTVFATQRTSLSLIVAMVTAGIAMGIVNPVTNGIVGRYIPAELRTSTVGVVQSGVQAGALLAGLAAPVAIALGGWERSLLVIALAPLVVALAAPRIVPPDTPRGQRRHGRASPALKRFTARSALYALAMALGSSTAIAYLPLFASSRLEFSDGTAGAVGAVSGAVGLAARLALTRSRAQLAHRLRPFLSRLALVASASLGLVAVSPLAPWLIWPAALLFGASALAWIAVLLAGLVEVAEPGSVEGVTGRVFVGFYVGLLAGPAAFGLLLRAGHSYVTGWLLAAGAFLVAAVLAATSVRVPVPTLLE